VYDLFNEGPLRWAKYKLFGYRTRATGRAVSVTQPKLANCFCLLGALKFVYPDANERRNATRRLVRAINRRDFFGWTAPSTIWEYNDEKATYETLLETVKEAGV
jgi:hypothetical protein